MFINLLIGSLMLGSIYGLIGLGYSIIYKASGLMNFAQGDLFMLGAFVGYTFYSLFHLPFFISFVLTFCVMFVLGFVIESCIIKKILLKSKTYLVILATIALSIMIKNVSMLLWGSQRLNFPKIFNIEEIKISGFNIQFEQIFLLIVSFICMIILHIFFKKTKIGTAMRAASMDPLAAKSCGINVELTTGITWGLASSIASIGGMLYGPVYGISIGIGATIGQRAFSSAVVGGYGNMYGAILGGFLIAFTETFAAGYISSELKDFISFIVLIIFLFFKPTGILNDNIKQERV